MVGYWVSLQQIPRAITATPPSEVTTPPVEAEFEVISVTGSSVTVGAVFMDSFLQLKIKKNSTPAMSTVQMAGLVFIVKCLRIRSKLINKLQISKYSINLEPFYPDIPND